jgi:exopolyphosphatase/guanosine-5'-triphosphate,3'-diphosphate pyrophosphatase
VNVAAIDIGTNSTNLLVVDEHGRTIERVVNITRLGRGVDSSRRLADDAVKRTLDCLAEYRRLLDRHQVARTRVTATSAVRDAANRAAFADRVRDTTSCELELLSGEEEGRLAHHGALIDLDVPSGRHLVIDIGGGSTELVVGEMVGGKSTMLASRSIDVGAVRLTERHLVDDPPRPEQLLNAIGDTHDLVDDVLREVPEFASATTIIGTSGTILTVAAVEIGQRSFDADALHGMHLSRAAVEDVFRTLATETLADRKHNPGLPADRADVIVGGLCVLVALMRKWDAPHVTVSARNIMDGICAELRGSW